MLDLNEVQGENTGWKPLKPGVEIPAILESVEFAKDSQTEELTDDIVFNFKGTGEGNTGTMNFRIWANTFDPEDDYYDKVKSDRTLAQVKHILAAFLPEEVIATVKGSTWKEISNKIVEVAKPEVINIPAFLKVIYDNKDRPTFPLFPDFVRTKRTPERTLTLNTKVNPKTGMPYDRIEPITQSGDDSQASFGDSAEDAPAPSFTDGPAFGQ